MLFAIGAGDEVVGVSSYDQFPPEALTKPKVGALVDPDFERILSLRPDLVVVYGTQIDLIARLERARIPTSQYELAGLPTSRRRFARWATDRPRRGRARAGGTDRARPRGDPAAASRASHGRRRR